MHIHLNGMWQNPRLHNQTKRNEVGWNCMRKQFHHNRLDHNSPQTTDCKNQCRSIFKVFRTSWRIDMNQFERNFLEVNSIVIIEVNEMRATLFLCRPDSSESEGRSLTLQVYRVDASYGMTFPILYNARQSCNYICECLVIHFYYCNFMPRCSCYACALRTCSCSWRVSAEFHQFQR